MRHEFAADERNQQQAGAEDQSRDHQGEFGMIKRPIQLEGVFIFHPLEGAVLLLADAASKPIRREHGNQRQGKNERPDERKQHGLSHGMEEFSRWPAQYIDWQITRENDGDRIEDRPINIFRSGQNDFVKVISLAFPYG